MLPRSNLSRSNLYAQTDAWIDDYQRKISWPIAQRIAEFCRDPIPDEQGNFHPAPLMGVEAFLAVSAEIREQENRLVVVMGPFAVQRDSGYTYWQGYKVFVGNATVVAALVRLSNRGHGGFLNIKLWDRYNQIYNYQGDPNQERFIPPEAVISATNDHMAAQYHVGNVERTANSLVKDQILERDSPRVVVADTAEAQRRIAFEKAAQNLRTRAK